MALVSLTLLGLLLFFLPLYVEVFESLLCRTIGNILQVYYDDCSWHFLYYEKIHMSPLCGLLIEKFTQNVVLFLCEMPP